MTVGFENFRVILEILLGEYGLLDYSIKEEKTDIPGKTSVEIWGTAVVQNYRFPIGAYFNMAFGKVTLGTNNMFHLKNKTYLTNKCLSGDWLIYESGDAPIFVGTSKNNRWVQPQPGSVEGLCYDI